MADLPDTPSLHGEGNGQIEFDKQGNKRARAADDDDDDDGEGKGRERRKIDIKFIQDKSRRHITFSKRKAGIMKKAYELSVLTGTQVLLLVVSETGLVYTFTTPKLQPLVTKAEGKNLIQACLNAPSPTGGEQNGLEDTASVAETLDDQQAQAPVQGRMPQNPGMQPHPQAYAMPPQDPMASQYYLQQAQQQQQGNVGQYPMPPQAQMPQHGQRH